MNSYNHKNKETFGNIQDFKEYNIFYNNNFYNFKISKRIYDIFIQSKNYELNFHHKDLQEMTKSIIESLDEGYKYITYLFDENMVNIKEIIEEKEIKIILNIYIHNKPREIELNLKYKNSKDITIKELNKKNKDLIDEIYHLKAKIKNLELEKSNYWNKQINYGISKINFSYIKSSSTSSTTKKEKKFINIKFLKNIVTNSYADDNLDNTFVVFKSIKDLLCLIYSTKKKSIIAFDIIKNETIKQIKKAHDSFITNFRHFCDKINLKDLILSISSSDNNLKVWDFPQFNCLCNIKNIYIEGELDSACILINNNHNYILTSNDNENLLDNENNFIEPGPIKEFDFKGNLMREIDKSNHRTLFIDTYYERNSDKIYIITGNSGFCKSYDYISNKEYRIYRITSINNNNNNWLERNCHCSVVINSYKDLITLIGACWDENIRIWNFHNSELIIRIKIGCTQGISLNNNKNYLYIGCDDKIKIIHLKDGKIVQCLKENEEEKEIVTIKKIIHPQYGECFLSQNAEKSQIKLWVNGNI